MKETKQDPSSAENPLGQFLSNGQGNSYITKQEEQVSAKLDKLNEIAIPRSASKEEIKRDDDSIVHLLNSRDYASPLPENNIEDDTYYYPGMSPPVTLPVPKDIPAPDLTSPVAEEPLPYTRPVEDQEESSQGTPLSDSALKQEKKAINLQTYLKRKKDDDPIEPDPLPTKEASVSPEKDEENLPPTPVKTPKDTDVDDDLLEWASQDADAGVESLEKAPTPEAEPDKTLDSEPATTPVFEKMGASPEESQEDIEAKVAAIRSPSASPIDSLLKEKRASPHEAVVVKENREEGELEPDSEDEKPVISVSEQRTLVKSRSRSHSQGSRKMKKDKKKKAKKKKKKEKTHDSDLEEDIRKLELLKAELEREERREKKEKERRRQRKRSASPRGQRDKKKKEKRQRR